jgi:hypothetical protein
MILPKKQDLDKAKNDERKRLIDDGIMLAKKVDQLRETSANEEKQLKDWRENSLKLVQQEIAQFIEKKETVKHEIEEAIRERQELLKPLTKEWTELGKAKDDLEKERQKIWEETELIKVDRQTIDDGQDKLSKLISKAKQNEHDTDKIKSEAISLKELAQREYEMAHSEHTLQTETFDTKLSEVLQRLKEYEVALSLIKIREHEVKDKESELLTREKHLASQQVALRIAYEEIKKNGNRMSTDAK